MQPSPHPSPLPLFDEMQKAVDIVNSSTHPVNKIAAALAGIDQASQPFSVVMTNYWPERIHACFGIEERIGNSSGTIHAETACVLTAPKTAGASLFITDPFCPNCAKNMAEAGIRHIYIDHKGFTKDFASRRRDAFDGMSTQICEKAGMAVYEINRKEQKVTPILPAGNFVPVEDRPVHIEGVEPGLERQSLDVATRWRMKEDRRFAIAAVRDASGTTLLMTAFSHPSVGFSYKKDTAELQKTDGKYSYILEPINRLLMNAARRGVKLQDGLLFSSQVPTSRELVNLVGAGLHNLSIGDRTKARDEDSLKALQLLEGRGLLKIQS